MSDSKTPMQEHLRRFGLSEDVSEQAAALSELMKIKQLHQAAKDPLFEQGVQTALKAATAPGDPERKLRAVATLLRIAELVKAWQPRMDKLLSNVWTEPLPPLQSLPDPKGREYVATLWRHGEQPWFRSYLATGAVEEEGSEPTRVECIKGLVALSPDLASVLDTLMTPMRRLDFGTEKRGDSKGKRVRRVLESLKNEYLAATKEPGQSAGEQLRRLMLEAFQLTGIPTTEAVLNQVSEEALGLVHAVVRAQFSTATSPETYAAMEVVSGWYRKGAWEDFAEGSPSARLLARDIAEALELLVRAGVADDVLYSRLAVASGSDRSARETAKSILARLPGLDDKLARWLSGAPVRRSSALATENQLVGFDEALADLMIDSARMNEMAEVIAREVLPEVAVMVPHAGGAIGTLLGLVRGAANAVEGAAHVRALRLSGAVGEVKEFSPLEHEMAGGPQPGIRSVRIIRPGVHAPSGSGGRRIVRKALVEPLI